MARMSPPLEIGAPVAIAGLGRYSVFVKKPSQTASADENTSV